MQKHPELPKPFADLGVEVRFLQALAKMGFVEPSVIQTELIPVALSGRDILGQARTGTGKTAAFGLPVLQQLDPTERLQAICLVPTRELAVQVAGEIKRLATFAGVHVAAVYGGTKVATQLHQLGRKPHFVVGTPGRVLDFLDRRALSLEHVRFVVLDEVDRMLDIGFRDDIRNILGRAPTDRQTIFVSATIDDEIKRLAMRYMREPAEINVSQDKLTVDEVDQHYVTVDPYDKFRVLQQIMRHFNPPTTIIFCNTKHAARKLAKKLHDGGIDCLEIHGDLMQNKRERVMEKFRKHQVQVLVATDLASRGIDVSHVSHIINYDIPEDAEIYVHRIGRTARMGARGVAITFVTREEGIELTRVEKLINREITPLDIPGYSPSPAREALPPLPPPQRRPEPAPQRTQPGRAAASTAAPASASTAAPTAEPRALPKTLGGRFKPSRRGRR